MEHGKWQLNLSLLQEQGKLLQGDSISSRTRTAEIPGLPILTLIHTDSQQAEHEEKAAGHKCKNKQTKRCYN